MAKVTSKLQITLPKRLAEQYGISAGDNIEFVAAGDSIRLLPGGVASRQSLSREERLRLFDEATARQVARERAHPSHRTPAGTPRDWRREDLYTRG